MTDAEVARLRSDGLLLRSIVSHDVVLKRVGSELKGRCPFHIEKTPSFVVYDDHFHCFGCQAHGSVFDYVMKREGIDFAAACRVVASAAGISITTPKTKGNGGMDNGWLPMVPPPAQAHPPDAKLLKQCVPFEYVDADGELLFYQRRFERRDGKSFAQLTYGTLTKNGRTVTGWHDKGPPQPYPLYRLDRLAQADPDSTVIVVEGEGKCQAAERMFPDAVCTAWLNGSNSLHLSDWGALKRFKETNIIWWPDADRPRSDGKPHGCFLATPAFYKLFPLARRVDTTRLDDIKDGYDAADLEHDGCDDPEAWLQARLRGPEPTHVWRSADHDFPCVPTGREERAGDGRIYAEVISSLDGSQTFVPKDQLHLLTDSTPSEKHTLPAVEWRDVRLADWAGRTVPERTWIVPEWIPREQVTGLYGIGGISKTDFLIQLLMASSLGLTFLGYQLAPVGPVYGLFCEDTEPEIIRRASRIAAHYGLTLADFPNVHFASLVGFDDPEFMAFDGPKPTLGLALLRFDRMIMQLGARLAILDTAPDFFGGTEISRRDVTRFVRKLDAVSITRSCAILFSAHPSVRGRASGSFDSGSTGWEAKVRARLSLHDPGNDDDDDDRGGKAKAPQPPTERRILTRQKANYAAPGATIELVCRDGVFTTAALDPEKAVSRGPGRNDACEARFLELLGKIHDQGGYVHDVRSVPDRYAPKVFAKRPDGRTFSAAEYSRAMQRLFVAERLRLEPYGKPSDDKKRLVEIASHRMGSVDTKQGTGPPSGGGAPAPRVTH